LAQATFMPSTVFYIAELNDDGWRKEYPKKLRKGDGRFDTEEIIIFYAG
jgi:hypothetical protein